VTLDIVVLDANFKSAPLVRTPLMAMVMKLAVNAQAEVFVTTPLVSAAASLVSLELIANTKLLCFKF
jgi:hypothetical protein